MLAEVAPAMAWMRAANERWGLCLQAGGNVGVWPLALAKWFGAVQTFEPEAQNHACLRRNVADEPKIITTHGALGALWGQCGVIEPDLENAGAHRVNRDFPGAIPLMPIDGLNVAPDLIWLDIEGYELQALVGARETLKAHKPMVILEMKGLGKHYGYEDQAIADLLSDLGYGFVGSCGNDQMFKCEAT